ncbi:MAG: DedA family protein [Prevotella sp.]|nr:DedA family protein [Prevotella sp.]
MDSAELFRWILENLNYWVVTVFMAIESSFIPFPSEVVVPPAAWKAMVDDDMNIFLVVIFATIGANIGSLINYYLARWLGRPIIYKFADSRIGHLCLINREKIENAERYFRDHGAVSTFIGRLIPAIRQLISIPAGLAGMKIGKFVLYTSLGAFLWNCVLALIGYLIYRFTDLKTTEAVYNLASKYSHEIGYTILIIVVVVIAVLVYKELRKNKKNRTI